MAGILVSWAIAESERLGERTAHGHAHRRKLGKPFGPSAPRGYQWNADRSNYELAPDADKYKNLIRRFQADPEIRKWLRYANEHGMGFGSPSAFTRWLQNPSLAGARVYGVSQRLRVPDERNPGRTRTIRRHNKPGIYSEIRWEAHPPLITREQHAWLLAHFESNRVNRDIRQSKAPLKAGRTRVVTGIGQCAACGKRLVVHQSSKKSKRHYRCMNQACTQLYKNRILEQTIIDAGFAELRLMAADLANHVAARMNENREPAEIVKLRGEIADAKALNNPRMAPVVEGMERELSVLLQRADLSEGRHGLKESLRQGLRDLLEMPGALEDSTDEERRAMFLGCIEAVVVDEGKVIEIKTRPIN